MFNMEGDVHAVSSPSRSPTVSVSQIYDEIPAITAQHSPSVEQYSAIECLARTDAPSSPAS